MPSSCSGGKGSEMGFFLIWWAWAIAAILLLGLEILLPGFLFLGFAIGAAVVGALLLLGILLGAELLLLIFALLSLIAWLALRRYYGRGQKAKIWDRDINDDV